MEYVELLDELDTDDVQPMAHAMDLSNVFADDQVQVASIANRRWRTRPNGMTSAIGSRLSWATTDMSLYLTRTAAVG